ncbi:MAG: tetraacyldisaccharide 4'-kinase [Bacteroidales bacterium]|nr:tetraacyldisaccharide 4'-kinase [Bacteroidales bacterium]
MEILRFLLYPFALVYGFFIFMRNKLFDWGLLRSTPFPLPIISVGNLVAGGSGKSPLVEYIVRSLKEEYKVAVLSRGYKRKTRGFRIVSSQDAVENVGDEPLQFASKFPEITVAVDESRRNGIRKLMAEIPGLEAVILDDAFQHRYVKPSISILVTDYHRIFTKDFLLPVGRLREHRKNGKRANIIVVSKTPKIFSPLVRRQLLDDLKPAPYQNVCFSYIAYDEWVPLYPEVPAIEGEGRKVNTILMLTGIVLTSPMEEYLRPFCSDLSMLSFPDHHHFSEKDIQSIKETFNSLPTRRKLIITTEKDAMRLRNEEAKSMLKDIPVYYLPIRSNFHPKDKEQFDSALQSLMNQKKLP